MKTVHQAKMLFTAHGAEHRIKQAVLFAVNAEINLIHRHKVPHLILHHPEAIMPIHTDMFHSKIHISNIKATLIKDILQIQTETSALSLVLKPNITFRNSTK